MDGRDCGRWVRWSAELRCANRTRAVANDRALSVGTPCMGGNLSAAYLNVCPGVVFMLAKCGVVRSDRGDCLLREALDPSMGY